MKNVATVLAAAAVALAFTACNKTQNGAEPAAEGRTGVQLSVSFLSPGGNRANITDAQDKEVVGTDDENAIKSGQILISDRPAIPVEFLEPNNNVWTSKVIKTDPAPSVTVTPVINMTLTKADLYKDNTVKIDQIEDLSSKTTGFAMTTSSEDASNTKKIEDNVEDPKGEGKNFFQFSLQRVVSKAQVWAEIVDVTGAEKFGVIDPASLSWSMAGSAKSAYLFTDYAGSTKADISLTDEGFYPSLQTISAKGGKTADGVKKGVKVYDLMKQSDYAKIVGQYDDTKAGVNNFKSRKLLKNGVELPKGQADSGTEGKSLENGIYFLEHALQETVKDDKTAYAPTAVTYGDVAYVKVYGKINIKKGKKVDAKVQATKPEMTEAANLYVAGLKPQNVVDANEDDFGERWYFIVVRTDSKWYNIYRKVKADVLQDRGDGTAYYLVHDKAGEFYAAGDGEDAVIYNTLAAALADGQTKVRKYWGADKDFNVVYLSPVNAQGPVNKVYNCDTRRNNIYDLKVRTISGLGFNYDPNDPDTPKDPSRLEPKTPGDNTTIDPIDPNNSDDPNNPNNPGKGKTPGDPNIPTPGEDNPFEPEPANPPVNNTKTCLQVECTVLSWNLVQRGLDFTGGTTGL